MAPCSGFLAQHRGEGGQLLLGLPFPVMLPGAAAAAGTVRDVVLVQQGRSSLSKLGATPTGWSIPGAEANPGTSRPLLQRSSTFPFLSLAGDPAAKAVFHSCVNIWKKRGGKTVISVKRWECGCPENKQKLCFFSERPL